MKVIVLTTFEAPYRVEFYEDLNKYCDLTVVCFENREDQIGRNKKWFSNKETSYKTIYLKKNKLLKNVCLGILGINFKEYDVVIIDSYYKITNILAMLKMKLTGKKYIISCDGGIAKDGKGIIEKIKKILLPSAQYYLTTGKECDKYLSFYNVDINKCYHYPFSSIRNKDLCFSTIKNKQEMKSKLKLDKNKMMILSVGQFIERKGFDVLIKALSKVDCSDIEVVIIGGKKTDLYEQLEKEYDVNCIKYIDFIEKEELDNYFMAADLFILPTREDIWGLVINEAMAKALPVISTTRCVAALELIENGKNGYLYDPEDYVKLADLIKKIKSEDLVCMGQNSLEKIKDYTIENMALIHKNVFEEIIDK